MAKAPADQFYFGDHIRDTRCLSIEARGAWMDILAFGFFKTPQGRISQDIDAWSRTFGTGTDTARSLLMEIQKREVGDVVTERNGDITVINRRKYGEWQEREGGKQRAKRYRDRHGGEDEGESNAEITETNGKITPYSSSSSSSSSSEEINIKIDKGGLLPVPFDISNQMQAWAKENCPSVKVKTEHSRFVVYYTTGKGKNAKRDDWLSAWQMWMLNAENRATPKIERNGHCIACGDRRRIVGTDRSWPCPDCRSQEYAAWLKGRDV